MADLSKCPTGGEHVLYAIESGNWVEEVGCENCDLKITGRKAPPPEPIHVHNFKHGKCWCGYAPSGGDEHD